MLKGCNRRLANEIPELLVVFWLSPVVWPADHHGVVLQTPQAPSLNQMRRSIPQVRGDHHLSEALHFLCLHQFTQRLQVIREEDEMTKNLTDQLLAGSIQQRGSSSEKVCQNVFIACVCFNFGHVCVPE